MQILKVKMGESKKSNGLFLRMSHDEALMLIESLAAQMVRNDPNSERQEFYAEDGTFFTIAVHKRLPSTESGEMR